MSATSRTVFAATVYDSLAAVNGETVLVHEVRQQLSDKFAVEMNELAAFVAFEMDVVGVCAAVVLIMGTLTASGDESVYKSFVGQLCDSAEHGCFSRAYSAAYFLCGKAFILVVGKKCEYFISLSGFISCFAHMFLQFDNHYQFYCILSYGNLKVNIKFEKNHLLTKIFPCDIIRVEYYHII